jgi:hypothetical protein
MKGNRDVLPFLIVVVLIVVLIFSINRISSNHAQGKYPAWDIRSMNPVKGSTVVYRKEKGEVHVYQDSEVPTYLGGSGVSTVFIIPQGGDVSGVTTYPYQLREDQTRVLPDR